MFVAYAVIFCLAFTSAVLLAPVVRLVAVRTGAMDLPDGGRKRHPKATPRLGGLVIAGAIFAASAAYLIMAPRVTDLIFTSPQGIAGFVAGLVIILGVGVWDDVRGVRPRTKLAFQTLAVVICFAAGYRVEFPFIRGGDYWLLSLPVTWFWLVACINAMNLVYGMDGLASGVAFFAGSVIFVLAAVYAKYPVALLSAAMLGSVVGFLMYNFHPAVMFLGDSGSLLLGYLIAIFAITASLKSHATVALLIPILALGLPIMDTLLAILRRWSRRLPVSRADREHIHHKLLELGFSHRGAVAVLYAACLALAVGALAVATASSHVVGLVMGGLFVGTVAAVRWVGAHEMAAFLRRLGEGLRAPGGERLEAAAKKSSFWLAHARTYEEVLKALEPVLDELGAARAEIRAAGGQQLAAVALSGRESEGAFEESFTLEDGKIVVLAVEGVGRRAAHLPGAVRDALNTSLRAVGESQGREETSVLAQEVSSRATA